MLGSRVRSPGGSPEEDDKSLRSLVILFFFLLTLLPISAPASNKAPFLLSKRRADKQSRGQWKFSGDRHIILKYGRVWFWHWKLHETQVEKLWCYYVLSRIATSRFIAVNWYLRVYWLLPLSIVDSFAEHRRFFCLESTLLLESTDEYLGQSINFISQRSLFLISTDSFSLHSLQIVDSYKKPNRRQTFEKKDCLLL